MKIVTFQKGSYRSIGAILLSDGDTFDEGDAKVIDLHTGYLALASEERRPRARQLAQAIVPRNMEDFLAGGEETMAAAQFVLNSFQYQDPSVGFNDDLGEEPIVYYRKEVRLLAPVTKPPRIICLSHNYYDFVEETGVSIPPEPRIFSKYFNAICGPEDPIIYPPMTKELGYEAELAFIVGKRGRYIPKETAYDFVAGYTILNDVSASDLTVKDKISVVRGKTFDNFAPSGPWMLTRDEIDDCHKLNVECRVNGKVMQKSNTENLIYDVPELVSFLSRIFTLEPGDIVATGTPGGLAKHRDPKAFMSIGDVCEVEIDRIGILKNTVVKEELSH